MSDMTAAPSPFSPADRPQLGLRERKKIKTREAIRTAMYALVKEQGYDATTIEQIAERAEVSPSTVFRYFPTKEDIVLTDEFDPLIKEELHARPADEPWMDTLRYVIHKAVRLGFHDDLDMARLRTHLMVQVPAVRSRMMESMSVTGTMLCEAIGERTGRDPESLEVRVYAMALIGSLMETSLYWAETGYRDDFKDLVERTLDVMEYGLPGGRP
ncbi:TetR/AcrR family transcriptional regulator [Streptomyces sp. NPDC101175]|uniref:TetR/AcrR family transcriptional regulator n=1 Tax=Streptomyces sp. NPDC101175 TaxID=3366123 RepID=UPI003835043C